MSHEHEVVRYFEQANPVPDPERLDITLGARQLLADRSDETAAAHLEPDWLDTPADAPRRGWVLRAAAALVVAGGIAGLLVSLASGGSDDRGPASSTVIDAPAGSVVTEPNQTPDSVPTSSTVFEVPAGISVTESGQTIESLVGDISWTRVDGDASSLPQEVLFEIDGRYFGVDDAGTSWSSDDTRTWTETDPLPDGDRNFVDFEGVWTILDSEDPSEPPRLGWWERDSSGVAELPGGWPERSVPGLRVTDRGGHIGQIAYELLVIETATYGLDPVNDIIELGDDIDERDVEIRWVDDHTYQVVTTDNGASAQIGPDLKLSTDPSNPRVVQITSPDGPVGQVGPWPSLDAEELIDRLRTGNLEAQRELNIGNRATHFWTGGTSRNDGEIVGFSGNIGPDSTGVGFTVVAENDGDGLSLRVGGNRVDEIPMSREGPITSMTVAASDAGAVLHLEIDPPHHAEAWFTPSGSVWEPTNAPEYPGDVAAAEFGWVKYGREELFAPEQLATLGYPLAVSADGTDWQSISIPLDIDPEVADEPPVATVTVAANQLFVSVDHGDERTLWIGAVDRA